MKDITDKPVCFVSHGTTHYGLKEWLPAARIINELGGRVVYFSDIKFDAEFIDLCGKDQIECVSTADIAGNRRHLAGNVFMLMLRVLRTLLFGCRVITEMQKALKAIEAARCFLDAVLPGVVVVHSDTFRTYLRAIIKEGRKRGITVIVAPLATAGMGKTYCAAKFSLDSFDSEFSMKPCLNRIAARLRPRWATDCFGVKMLAYPVTANLVYDMTGLDVPQPWSRSGGRADRVLVHSEIEKDILLAEGVPESKLTVTGRALFDEMTQAIDNSVLDRKTMLVSLGLDPDRFTVLVNVPWRSPEPGYDKWDGVRWPWEIFMQEMDFIIMTCLRNTDAQVILHSHPGHSDEGLKPLIRDRVVIGNRYKFPDVISHADLYITEISSTMMLAMYAGKPVNCLSYWEYDPTFTKKEYRRDMTKRFTDTGVVFSWSRAEFVLQIESLCNDSNECERWTAQQKDCVDKWFISDGKCAFRMAEEIMKLRGEMFRP